VWSFIVFFFSVLNRGGKSRGYRQPVEKNEERMEAMEAM